MGISVTLQNFNFFLRNSIAELYIMDDLVGIDYQEPLFTR